MSEPTKKIVRNNMGFTLIEISISMTILSLLVIGVLGILGRNLDAWHLQEGMSVVNSNLRQGESRISADITTAAFLTDSSVGVTGISVGPSSVTFQRPAAFDGQLWSSPVTIRLRNEDLNGDLLLSPGEDINGNGVLDRVIERLEDGFGGLPPNGDFNDPGETRILCRDMDGAVFTIANNQLQATLTSTHLLDSVGNNRVTGSMTFSIFLVN